MNKKLHSALILLAAFCLYAAMPAYGQSGDEDQKNAERQFNTQMIGALNNDPKSQYNVAQMYEQGVGIPQDLGMAKMWYTKSANQGYDPATKKLANWELEKKQAQQEHLLRRTEEQKRREAEAKAAAARAEEQKRREAAAKIAAAKAAAARAEEQKRRDAEAKAKAAAAKAAAARAEEQKRRDAEAKAAAARAEEQKHREAETASAARSAQPAEPVAVVKEKQIKTDRAQDSHKSTGAKTDDKTPVFRANPCDTPTAKFTSTCQ